MSRERTYEIEVSWTGNTGQGTANYRSYSRDHVIQSGLKPAIPGSSDPSFRGDRERYNPEELLLASLSGCHMLWYLHLCAEAGIVVTEYRDVAVGRLAEYEDGAGQFTGALLSPEISILEGGDLKMATELHQRAHEHCFIARSVNFEVTVEPKIDISEVGS